jgi:predicted metal-dependent phosphoesterase TrpH
MSEPVYFQMHCHSRNSVNRLSGEGVFHRHIWPLERVIVRRLMNTTDKLIKLASYSGVDLIAITDHNTVTQSKNERIIQGEEWGQRKGHANFINIMESIDPEAGFFRNKNPEHPKSFTEAANDARQQGGFVSINHPFKSDKWLWGRESLNLADAIEIWNGTWNEENEKALNLWQDLLASGMRIFATGGSDFHVKFRDKIYSPLVAFENVNSSKESILSSLSKGRFSVVKDPMSPLVFLREDMSYAIFNPNEKMEMITISRDQRWINRSPPPTGYVKEKNLEGFVRVELWDSGSPLSFSNPVFL